MIFEFDLSGRVGVETTVSGWDAARFQRAAQRAGQSTRRGRDYVVQRGRVRLVLTFPQPIMLGDLAVHAEYHRRVLGRNGGVPEPAGALDLDLGSVDDIAHDKSFRNWTQTTWIVPPACASMPDAATQDARVRSGRRRFGTAGEPAPIRAELESVIVELRALTGL